MKIVDDDYLKKIGIIPKKEKKEKKQKKEKKENINKVTPQASGSTQFPRRVGNKQMEEQKEKRKNTDKVFPQASGSTQFPRRVGNIKRLNRSVSFVDRKREKWVNLKIPISLKRELKDFCQKNNLSMAGFIRIVLILFKKE